MFIILQNLEANCFWAKDKNSLSAEKLLRFSQQNLIKILKMKNFNFFSLSQPKFNHFSVEILFCFNVVGIFEGSGDSDKILARAVSVFSGGQGEGLFVGTIFANLW